MWYGKPMITDHWCQQILLSLTYPALTLAFVKTPSNFNSLVCQKNNQVKMNEQANKKPNSTDVDDA